MAVRLVVGPHHRQRPKWNWQQHAAPTGNGDSLGLRVSAIPGDLARQTRQNENNEERSKKQHHEDNQGEALQDNVPPNLERSRARLGRVEPSFVVPTRFLECHSSTVHRNEAPGAGALWFNAA